MIAFLVALNQNEALLGSEGLLPANMYLGHLGKHIDHSGWFQWPKLFSSVCILLLQYYYFLQVTWQACKNSPKFQPCFGSWTLKTTQTFTWKQLREYWYHFERVDSFACNAVVTVVSSAGLGLSVLVFVTGSANMIVMLLLWLLYHSIVIVGQNW